jgi:cardiolipin synthase A/B
MRNNRGACRCWPSFIDRASLGATAADNIRRPSPAAGCWPAQRMSGQSLLLLLLLLFLMTGCAAALPDANEEIARNQAVPRLQDSHGPLSPQQSAVILKNIRSHAGETGILERHIALEEAIAGSPLVIGNKATLLQDGPATYRAMFAAMNAATDHINMETYLIDDDEIGRQFADILIRKQKQGVQVNLIYDSIGTLNLPRNYFDRLRAAGIALLEFNPVNPLEAKKEWSINHRDHRKLLVVDGRIAFVGGINISGVYSSGSFSRRRERRELGKWRDTHVRIEGPVVTQFQKSFLETWKKQSGPPLAPRRFFPSLTASGNDVVRVISSSADDRYSLIYVTLISAINSAESRVYLTNAYFVPDPQLLKALQDAAQRGVDVRLILPSHTDFWAVFHAGRSHYSELLRTGVKIYERRGPVLHSKTALIDGVWSCIGSTNLDWRSFLHNDEINAVVLGIGFARQMQAMFDQDLAQSDQIDPVRWEQRSPLLRLKEWAAHWWEYWL